MVAYLAEAKQYLEEMLIGVLGFALPIAEGLILRSRGVCDFLEEAFGFRLKCWHDLGISICSLNIP